MRDVCRHCNGGWLSALEKAVKPILAPLASGDKALAVLKESEERLLVRWAAKTALLLHWSSDFNRTIPLESLQHLYQKDLPNGISIFAIQTDRSDQASPINCLQSQNWRVYNPYEDAIAMWRVVQESCKISIRIDRLHLLIAYVRNLDSDVVGWRRVHRPLAPTRSDFWYEAALDLNVLMPRVESAMVMFHVSLCLALNCSQQDILAQRAPNLLQLHDEFFHALAADSKDNDPPDMTI
jgi:hypothetical protein